MVVKLLVTTNEKNSNTDHF